MLGICSLTVLVLLLPAVMYGSETMLWKEKENSGIRGIQMDNLRGLLGIRKMNKTIESDKGGRQKD